MLNGKRRPSEVSVDFSSLRELFWLRGGPASPARLATKTLSMHGAKTPMPRRGADPSAAKYYQIWSVNQIQRNGARWGEDSFPERTVLGAWWAGFARPPRTQNSLYARGENADALPRRGPVRRRGTIKCCQSISH